MPEFVRIHYTRRNGQGAVLWHTVDTSVRASRHGASGYAYCARTTDQDPWCKPCGNRTSQVDTLKGVSMTTPRQRPESEPLLTPSEVATLFRVDPKTVTRWAKAGKLTSIRTLGGHRRYRESEVRALLEGNTQATVGA